MVRSLQKSLNSGAERHGDPWTRGQLRDKQAAWASAPDKADMSEGLRLRTTGRPGRPIGSRCGRSQALPNVRHRWRQRQQVPGGLEDPQVCWPGGRPREPVAAVAASGGVCGFRKRSPARYRRRFALLCWLMLSPGAVACAAAWVLPAEAGASRVTGAT